MWAIAWKLLGGWRGAAAIGAGLAAVGVALFALHIWNGYQDRGVELDQLRVQHAAQQKAHQEAEASFERTLDQARITMSAAIAVERRRAEQLAEAAEIDEALTLGEAGHDPEACDAVAYDLLFDRLGRLRGVAAAP